MSAAVGPDLTDVEAVVEEVWRSLLGDADPLLPGPAAGEVSRAATVTITGAWAGAVTLEDAEPVAQELARRMFATAEPSDADAADAVGEVANMVGGNLKSLLPGPNQLSLPVSVQVTPVGSEPPPLARYDAHWRGEPLRLTVHAG